MSAASAARERLAAWNAALDLYGYQASSFIFGAVASSETTFTIHRAVRPAVYGDPTITIDVWERWQDGPDPAKGLRRSLHGAYLEAGTAHAQLLPGDEGADRIDVDPTKPTGLRIHRHPLGRPNHVRQPLPAIVVPEDWLNEIEDFASQIAGF